MTSLEDKKVLFSGRLKWRRKTTGSYDELVLTVHAVRAGDRLFQVVNGASQPEKAK